VLNIPAKRTALWETRRDWKSEGTGDGKSGNPTVIGWSSRSDMDLVALQLPPPPPWVVGFGLGNLEAMQLCSSLPMKSLRTPGIPINGLNMPCPWFSALMQPCLAYFLLFLAVQPSWDPLFLAAQAARSVSIPSFSHGLGRGITQLYPRSEF
jgi:hypothetical protein